MKRPGLGPLLEARIAAAGGCDRAAGLRAAGGRLRVPVLAVLALELVARTCRSHVRRVTLAALAAVLACGLAVNDAAAQSATVTLTLGQTTLAESAGATGISVTAELSATESSATVVTLSLAGTANGETDYEVVGTIPSISIPAGQTTASATLSVRPTDDAFWEGDESIEVQGTASNSATVQGATLTLADDDSRPGITIEVPSIPVIAEDAGAATTVRISARLTKHSVMGAGGDARGVGMEVAGRGAIQRAQVGTVRQAWEAGRLAERSPGGVQGRGYARRRARGGRVWPSSTARQSRCKGYTYTALGVLAGTPPWAPRAWVCPR